MLTSVRYFYNIDIMRALNKTFNGLDVRIIDRDGNPWFVVSDICKVLGIANPSDAVKNHLDDDLDTSEVIDSMGRTQVAKITNESGLYQLIFKSKKNEAVAFRRWVTSEVLPSIRKTGQYSISQSLKEKSKKTRNLMTDAWHENGINAPKEYAYLTLEEYRLLQFKKNKRKKDFSEGEIKTLMALEALEMVNLHYNPVNGVIECKKSLSGSAKKVLEIKENRGVLEEKNLETKN